MEESIRENLERDENFEPPQLHIPNVTAELRMQDNILRNKMADSQDNEFNKLLQYYRQRIDVYEEERIEWLQKIEETRANLKEKHQLENKLKDLKTVISDIQQSISEQKISAFSERMAYLNLTRLNSDLKIKDVQNRKKIAELIALSDPKKNSTLQHKYCIPRMVGDLKFNNIQNKETEKSRCIENDLNIYHHTGQQRTVFGSNEQRSQITTVYFPNENLNSIAVENESLKEQQKHEKEAFERQFETLQKELAVRDTELKLKEEDDKCCLQDLEKKTAEQEKKHYLLNKLYFDTRRRCNESIQKLLDEKIFLQQRNVQLNNKLEFAQKTTEIENEALRELETKKALEYTNKFQNQVKSKSEKIEVMKEQYAQIQNMYQQKTKELENTYGDLLERYNMLQMETEQQKINYADQIDSLKEELQQLEQEQVERGLVPAKPAFKSKEQRMIEEQEQIQNELEMQKMERKREKRRIYRDSAAEYKNTRTSKMSQNDSRQMPKQRKLKGGSVPMSDIKEVERELESLKNGFESLSRND